MPRAAGTASLREEGEKFTPATFLSREACFPQKSVVSVENERELRCSVVQRSAALRYGSDRIESA
jgi:hypothetical protein